MAERFLKRGDMQAYEREAQDFLKTHPESEFAPRAALDLLIYATAADRKDLAEEMQLKLALDYPESMQASYLQRTFAKDEDYRKLLAKLLERNARSPRDDFPKAYQRALGAGTKRFGKGLLNDSDFLLKSAIIVGATGDADAQQTLMAVFHELAKNEEALRKIAGIAADEKRPSAERAQALHQESENATAAFLRDFFLSRLSAEEKESAGIRRVIADSHLVKARFSDALALLEKLPADADPDKVLFQRIWCHASKGEPAKVAALQSELDEKFPQSPWCKEGHAVLHAAENAEKNMGLYAEALHAFADDAKKQFGALECTILSDGGDASKKLTVYLALSTGTNYLELQIRQGADLMLAYRSTGKDASLFSKDDAAIHHFLQPGPVPIPVLNLERDKDGSFQFTFNAQFQSGFKGAAADSPTLLDSPFLSTREGALDLLRSTPRTGALLADVTESAGVRKFALVFRDALKPGSTEVAIMISPDHRITRLHAGKFELRDIRYGPADSVKFTPPAWPEAKTVTAETFDIAYFFKFFGKVMEIFSSSKGGTVKTQ